MFSRVEPTCQVSDHISPACGPPHRPAGRAVVLVEEGRLAYAVAPPPVQVPSHLSRAPPQHQQVLGQLFH